MRIQSVHCPPHLPGHTDVLQHFARTPDASLHADPHSAGVYRDDTGNAYIKADDRTYAVKFDRDNGTWRIHHPDEPAKPAYPVRIDERGRWGIHHDVGLEGGGPRLTREVIEKIRALLKDGWSATAVKYELGVSFDTVYRIKKETVLSPETPLASIEFRKEVASRLSMGTSAQQIARDLGVQSETVHLIEGALKEAIVVNDPRVDVSRPGAPSRDAISTADSQVEPAWSAEDCRLKHMGNAIDRRIVSRRLSPGTQARAIALLRDGCSVSEAERELRLSMGRLRYWKLRIGADTAEELSPDQMRREVLARLDAGMSDERIVHDLGVQPEAVRLIRGGGSASARGPVRPAQSIATTIPTVASSGSTVSTVTSSPQPGTSTGGWTYPAARSLASTSQGEFAERTVHRGIKPHDDGRGTTSELKAKINSLLLDGWSKEAVASRLNIDLGAVSKLWSGDVVQQTAPLVSVDFREHVAARLDAGIPFEQVARDLQVHPETILLIEEALRDAAPGRGNSSGRDASANSVGIEPVELAGQLRRTGMHLAVLSHVTQFPFSTETIATPAPDTQVTREFSVQPATIQASIPSASVSADSSPTGTSPASATRQASVRSETSAESTTSGGDEFVTIDVNAFRSMMDSFP